MASLSCNSGAYTLVGAASVIAFSLSIASSSYAVTGGDATFGRLIFANSGSYAVTGQPIQSRRVTAEPAGYLLNGSAVTFHYNPGSKTVSAVSGSYAITGTTATKIQYSIPYTKGVYSLTGSTVILLRSLGPRFVVVGGSYGITGTSAGLLSTVTIGTGDYQLTGTAVTFRKGKSLAAGLGAYTVNGVTSTRLEQSRHFPSASGLYSIIGGIATLRLSTSTDIVLVLNSANYSLTGTPATLQLNRVASIVSGTYVLTGGHTVFKKQYDSGVYGVTGQPVTFLHLNKTLGATSGTYILTGTVANLVYSIHRLNLDSGLYSISGPVTTILPMRFAVSDSGAYTLVGSDTELRATQIILDSGNYTITGSTALLTTTHRSRWHKQPHRPPSTIIQVKTTSTWDPQDSPPGV
jgi:hypothetical protein